MTSPAIPDRSGSPVQVPLSDLDRSLLAFESQWWQRPGAKEQAIAGPVGITPTRYLQLLNRLIDEPGALAHDPVVVNRLRWLRERRSARRGQLLRA